MEGSAEALDLLALATQAVNQLRTVLAAVSVPLPAVLAQLLTALVLGVVGWYLFGAARARKRSTIRLGARIGVAAVALGILTILVAWVDNLVVPRKLEIMGRVSPSTLDGLRIDLIDYQDQPMGAGFRLDDHGTFVLRYEPSFADPPTALLAEARGCEAHRLPLRRAHLVGALLHLQMRCGGES